MLWKYSERRLFTWQVECLNQSCSEFDRIFAGGAKRKKGGSDCAFTSSGWIRSDGACKQTDSLVANFAARQFAQASQCFIEFYVTVIRGGKSTPSRRDRRSFSNNPSANRQLPNRWSTTRTPPLAQKLALQLKNNQPLLRWTVLQGHTSRSACKN